MRPRFLATCLAVMLLAAPAARAAPMGFKDSVMLMGDFSPSWQESFANYALTSRDAVGAEALRMRAADKNRTYNAALLNYTRLLQRWNLPDAQANLWLFAGVGGMRGGELTDSQPLLSPGIQADYETTRVYVAATGRLYRGSDIRKDYTSLRAGFSFYEADYDAVQPWLVLEARRMGGLSAKTEVMPMLRVIASRFFVEAGVSTRGEGRLNVMYTF